MKFTAAQRLRIQADFVRAREKGLRLDCGSFLLNAYRAEDAGRALGGVRFGVVSAKKLLGCAVRRNRARRVFREIFRLHPELWPDGWDVVVVPRRSMFSKTFAALEKRYLECSARLLAQHAARNDTGVPPVSPASAETPQPSESRRVLECGTSVPLLAGTLVPCAEERLGERQSAGATTDAAAHAPGRETKVFAQSGTEVPHSKTRPESSRCGVGACCGDTGEPPVPLSAAAAAPNPAQRVVLALLWFYKACVSRPLHFVAGPFAGCRFTPTCSEYARQAVLRHGVLRGGWLALKRLARCNPLFRGGVDEVP